MGGRPFRLPKSTRRGLALLAFLLALLAAWRVGRLFTGREREVLLSPAEADSLLRFGKEMEANGQNGKRGNRPAELFPFDPNHADSATLLRLGFAPWQVRNILKYRAKGGRWRSPEDLQRLYGITRGQYARLRPYVRIAPQDAPPRHEAKERYGTPRGEKPVYRAVEKYPEGTRLPLNTADTLDLQRIPGIGPYYARKICRYRERLGGFVSVSQLSEVEGLPAGVSRWFTLEGERDIRRIRINHADFSTLVRHPYLDADQTKAILRHIRSYGPLRGWRDLRLYPCFAERDFQRLSPYFVFD